MKRHAMDMLNIPKMSGFSNELSRLGYQTVFFTTHDELFDNMSGFLSANDFNTIIGQKDYPLSEIKSTLGVPDEYMFRFAIPKLNKLSNYKKPFFAAFMTGSNHGPLVIPENTGFKRRHKEDNDAIVEYADWSLQKFMDYASKQPWYNNTVFVFVADHGSPLWNDMYDAQFTYQHIPFVIYAPNAPFLAISPRKLALQSDVFPTVMSLISPEYINNTFGIDLFQQKHDQVVFSSDDVLCCLNDSLMYIYKEGGIQHLFKYRDKNKYDFINDMPNVVQHMANVSFSWLQTSQWMIANEHLENKTFRKNLKNH
jgi:phosphoglycerol transferase MdoB-like AlkP superfamily enzyme